MTSLEQIRRPHISLIKLVECVGTLLEIPKSKEKSAFRAPLPSNYDKTIEKLKEGDFYDILNNLSVMKSSDIKNDVASDFYNKTLEPGFNYEDAINAGGLLIRELFNVVFLILLRLQSDGNRIPICKHNISVLVDGSRSSYVAFDTACHIHNHGTLNIFAFTIEDDALDNSGSSHLLNDLKRRCKSHYKFPDHAFALIGIKCPIAEMESQSQIVESHLVNTESSEYNIGEAGTGALALWATWKYSADVVLCKGMSPIRPFSQVNAPRSFLLYLDSKDEGKIIFLQSLKFMRPGDSIVLLTIVESRNPVGDSRDTRYDFGRKCGFWVNGPEEPAGEPDRVGWNDTSVEEIRKSFEDMIKYSFLDGSVQIETKSATCSNGKSDAILIGCKNNKDSIIECVRESNCSIIVLK
eukprot:gene27716-36533_t